MTSISLKSDRNMIILSEPAVFKKKNMMFKFNMKNNVFHIYSN